MAVPRFLFVPGVAVGAFLTPPWPSEWAAEATGWAFPEQPGSGESRTAWRLLGANNRELGRSAKVYRDLDSCREAVRELRDKLAGAESLIALSETTGLWTWRLNVEGRWVAVAGRSYQRRRECAYNLAQFLAAAPAAIASDHVVMRTRVRQIGHRATVLVDDLAASHALANRARPTRSGGS
jgi:hypothetical protein